MAGMGPVVAYDSHSFGNHRGKPAESGQIVRPRGTPTGWRFCGTERGLLTHGINAHPASVLEGMDPCCSIYVNPRRRTFHFPAVGVRQADDVRWIAVLVKLTW